MNDQDATLRWTEPAAPTEAELELALHEITEHVAIAAVELASKAILCAEHAAEHFAAYIPKAEAEMQVTAVESDRDKALAESARQHQLAAALHSELSALRTRLEDLVKRWRGIANDCGSPCESESLEVAANNRQYAENLRIAADELAAALLVGGEKPPVEGTDASTNR